MKSFTEMALSPYLLNRLAAAEFVTPTAVQAAAIPAALLGTDVLATAQTGTGKTLAFLLPIMEQMLKQTAPGLSALVLVPTRELAIQVVDQYKVLMGKKLKNAALVVGGLSEREQLQSIRNGAQLMVATPGRLEDYMSRGLINFNGVRILVLDEADRMLDMGFIPAIRRIVAKLPKTRQTLCFSATLETSVQHLIGDYLRNPVRLAFGSVSKPKANVKLQAFEVPTDQKLGLLQQLLERESGRSLVFARTKRATERLTQKLVRQGFSVGMLHGDRTQSQRNAALAGFQQGRFRVLVATDVASRGIHVEDIAHVINYDLPEIAENFIHRVGRTGRLDSLGTASTFHTRQEAPELRQLERMLSIRMERMSIDGELSREVRPGPIDVSNLVMKPAGPKTKMMCLPGEVLQKHETVV